MANSLSDLRSSCLKVELALGPQSPRAVFSVHIKVHLSTTVVIKPARVRHHSGSENSIGGAEVNIYQRLDLGYVFSLMSDGRNSVYMLKRNRKF